MRQLAILFFLLAGALCLSSCVIRGKDSAETTSQTAVRSGDGYRYEGFALGASLDFVVAEIMQNYERVNIITDHVAGASAIQATAQEPGEILATSSLMLGFAEDSLYAIMDYTVGTHNEADALHDSYTAQHGVSTSEAPEELQSTELLTDIIGFFGNPSYEASHWYDAERGYALSMFIERLQVVGGPDLNGSAVAAAEAPAPDGLSTANVMIYIFDLAGLDENYATLKQLR